MHFWAKGRQASDWRVIHSCLGEKLNSKELVFVKPLSLELENIAPEVRLPNGPPSNPLAAHLDDLKGKPLSANAYLALVKEALARTQPDACVTVRTERDADGTGLLVAIDLKAPRSENGALFVTQPSVQIGEVQVIQEGTYGSEFPNAGQVKHFYRAVHEAFNAPPHKLVNLTVHCERG